MGKLGTLEPVEYYVNYESPEHEKGYILIAPYTGCPEPAGYRREYADTLQAVYRLEKILQRQEAIKQERAWEADVNLRRAGQEAIRDRLVARMVSSHTSQYEKDFIREYLKIREDRLDHHAQRFLETTSYLHALHFDTPKNRRVDEESVNLDRLNVRMER